MAKSNKSYGAEVAYKNPKVRLRRLKTLLHMMENHDKIFPNVQFKIESWLGGDIGSCKLTGAKLKTIVSGKKYKDCGSSACVLGSAALYEPFRKEGLTVLSGSYGTAYDKRGTFNNNIIYTEMFTRKELADLRKGGGVNGLGPTDFGQTFFGLTFREASALFIPDSYVNEGFGYDRSRSGYNYGFWNKPTAEPSDVQPKQVIGRIKKLIRHYEKTNVPLWD